MYSYKPNNQTNETQIQMTKKAIKLAIQGDWNKAVRINKELISLNPNDTETHNRLGKALEETGRYKAARDAFQKALELSPHNNIAARNLSRLNDLAASNQPPKRSKQLFPSTFITEQSKTITTSLYPIKPNPSDQRLVPGDLLQLRLRSSGLVVLDSNEQIIGTIDPTITSRLSELISGGNKYQASVTSLYNQRILIMIQETYQHPTQINITSFPIHKSLNRKWEPQVPVSVDFDDSDDVLVDRDPLEIHFEDDEYLEPEVKHEKLPSEFVSQNDGSVLFDRIEVILDEDSLLQ